MSKFQSKQGKDNKKAHMVSISIDPEKNTPAKLLEYTGRFKAGAGWDSLYRHLDASMAIQKAFNAYRGGKTNHTPFTLVRAAPGKPWVRLDGFANPDDLLGEYRKLSQEK